MGNSAADEREPASAELWLLRAQHAVFEVAARHDDLLRRDAFEELAAALAEYVPLGRLVLMVPEGNEQVLYAASVGSASSPVPPFGARFPLPDAGNRGIVMDGGVRVCRDTRLGDAVDRLVAQSGYLSYTALPIRDLGADVTPAPIVAKLIACFPLVDQSAQVPVELLETLTTLFGARFRRGLAMARDRRLAMILETSGEAMLAWNTAGQIADANAAACRLTGLTHSELIGSSVEELVPEVAQAEPERSLRTRLRTRSAEGSLGWLPVSITVTVVQDDPVVAAHMLARDVGHVVSAEREAAEHLARVRALEHEHRRLLDNAPLVIFRLDPRTGDLRYLNRHAEVLLGISPEHARERPGCLRAAHAHPEAAARFEEAFQRARRGEPLEPYEARLVRPDGTEIGARASIYALTEQQNVVAIEGILVDISAEQAARTQLVQTDRLSTLGRLAATVAHEINNPAAFLMLGLDHLTRICSAPAGISGGEPGTVLKLLEQLTESLQRIADIVRDLRLFAGPVQARLGAAAVPADVQRTVHCALTLTRSQLVERARLVLDLEPVPPVLVEQGRLAQVIVNLLVNAAQAIPKDSQSEHQITLRTRSHEQEVQIEISDTGVGIASADLARIWTPFFTTKVLGAGTGLGLSISRDMVERAGGRIEVVSPAFDGADAPRIGSRFIVHLKRADALAPEARCPPSPELAAPAQVRGAPDGSAPRKRILIVEDELFFGRALAEELREHHDTQLAAGGAQALARLESERFDLVISDLRMPGISGQVLYAQACARHPRYRQAFIFMTGLGVGADLPPCQGLARCAILEKPFPVERLLQAIDQLG